MSRAKRGESNPPACMEITSPPMAARNDILATEHSQLEFEVKPK